MWGLLFLISCFATLVAAEAQPALVGKIVAVDNPDVKRNLKVKSRNQVFATRGLSFLKQDGDLFKVHRPGLMGAEKTVSFESMRLPGFYLRQKNNRVHLDNLQSKFIKKDATFLESKDPVGETFRLFMHHDKFLCHEPKGGFNLFMQKDSPSRDTLNCAFNIVPLEQGVAKSKNLENSTAQKVEVKSFEALVKDIKDKQNPLKKHDSNGLVIEDENTSLQNKATSSVDSTNPAITNNQQHKMLNSHKTNAKNIDSQSNGTVLPPAGLGKNVPLQSRLKGVKGGFISNKAPNFRGKEKQKGFSVPPAGPGKVGAKLPSSDRALRIKQSLKWPQIGLRQGSILSPQQINKNKAIFTPSYTNMPYAYQPIALPSPIQNSFADPRMQFSRFQVPPLQHGFSAPPQPARNIKNAYFKMAGNRWVQGNPTKKVLISNAASYNKGIQLPVVYPQFPLSNNPYSRTMYQMYPSSGNVFPNYRPGYPHQARPMVKQQITHDPTFQMPAIENNPGKLQIQYVPPQQWNRVLYHQQSQVNTAGLPVQMQSTFSKETHLSTVSSPVAHNNLDMVSTDNLLSKLHPELSLDHTANHDVNEISSTATELHHIVSENNAHTDADHHAFDAINSHTVETLSAGSPVAPASNIDLHVGLPVDTTADIEHHVDAPVTATHVVSTAAVSPLISTPHLESPVTSVESSTLKPEPIHVLHEPELSTESQSSDGNIQAANSLVHSNPDITLQEAFSKMNPIDVHPIEVTSEPVHHILNEPESAKAFHMRTHYVTGKPVDMDGSEPMKEVHVVHHDHHIIHEANDDERSKFLSSIMDVSRDLCISLAFNNQLGSKYRLVSTINPHGYRPKGIRFSLKTIFKDPKKRKIMSFKAYDEADPHRNVLLNGHKELNILPTPCSNPVLDVTVASTTTTFSTVTGKRRNTVKAVNASSLLPDPKPSSLACPRSCSSECAKDCPIACCSDASSSLLH